MASLFLGVGLVLFCGFPSTTTLWASFLVISVAVFSEVPLNSAATHKVFSWAFLPPIIVLFFTTSCTAVWGHDNLVRAFLVRGDAGHHLLVGVDDPLGTSWRSHGPRPV